MPKDKYSEGDIDALKAKMAQLYAAKYAGDKVERVVITSEDWIAQARAEVNNDGNIQAGFYKYIYTHIAVKKKSGHSVYLIGFRKTWTGTGEEFGPLQLHSIGDNYPILVENIKK